MMAEYPANIVAIKISSVMIVISGTVRKTEFFCPHVKKKRQKKKQYQNCLLLKNGMQNNIKQLKF